MLTLTNEVSGAKQTAESFLEHDHVSIGRLFTEFQSVVNEGDAECAFDLLDLIWARLGIHIRAEHLCVFPAILNAPAQRFKGRAPLPALVEAQEAVKLLRSDHDFFMHELASAVNALRRLKASKASSGGELHQARRHVEAVCARLEEHNRLEEEGVYRWLALLLTEAEQYSLLAAVVREFEKQPPRFAERGMFPAASDV